MKAASWTGFARRARPIWRCFPRDEESCWWNLDPTTPREANALATKLAERLKRSPASPDVRLYSSDEAKWVWKIRESGARSAAAAPGAPPEWEGWDDAAVAPEKVSAYLRDIRKLLDEYNYRAAFYGHFGHGCIHMRVSFDLESEAGIRNYGEFVERAADLVVSYGGSLSGEHGDGQSRGALLPKMFGPELVKAFGEFKAAWDPGNKMNPHKVVNAYLPTENLRLGADYKPLAVTTHFQFPNDGGSFAKATVRCVGLGDCRKTQGGSMCPSYMATLEEKHSTRGRAHMLFELLQGEIVRDGWRDENVKEALDLCLSCKACKSECPTNVDIATYRAEFLSHYYEGRRRPLHAEFFGTIDRWARLASFSPGAANLLSHAPGIEGLIRLLLRLPSERKLPRFARAHISRLGARPEGFRCAGYGTRSEERRGATRDCFVAGYIHQLFSSRDRARGAGGPGERGIPGERSSGASVLRPAAVRFWDARSRQRVPGPNHEGVRS